ncbi:phage/plasmid primase, P4 family [Shimia abyssi]|uniref:P4 family phage/plasmid primase-like protein n=1 Tax=Shimia abyssi TaxID=1662395 RepID=A0A2P8FIV4_9RHOB|nr:phage/plasmid primase, P4 family [Shimia abyssi]PSL21639.1 P4 family phage/plasmid primase-like protein [Shimia abyssi]
MKLPERYILWKLTNDRRKVPCDERGVAINPYDPLRWMTFEAATSKSGTSKGLRIGWVLSRKDDTRLYGPNDGWFFLDLDKCRQSGEWTPEAQSVFTAFKGALGEVSVSGMGLHVIGRFDPQMLQNRRNKWDGWLEFYSDKRFVALSDNGLSVIGDKGDGLTDCTEALKALVPFRNDPKAAMASTGLLASTSLQNSGLPEGADPNYSGPENDEELIDLALQSGGGAAAKFGMKACFRDLWEAREETLRKHYPSPTDDGFDHSSADLALMNHLAFWTGKDRRRMDRLFRRSGLMRDKYELRADYHINTIQYAIRSCEQVYQGGNQGSEANAEPHALMPDHQLALTLFEQHWRGRGFYIPERDRWAFWKEGRWQLSSNKQEALTRVRTQLAQVRTIGIEKVAQQRKRLGQKKSIDDIAALMKSTPGASKPLAEWDADPLELGTPSSVIDLRTGQARPRKREDFLLNSTSCDPGMPGFEPTNWFRFLSEITKNDPELIEFLQRLAGYAATGSTKEQMLFFALGTGRNGKGTFLNTIGEILGNDYTVMLSNAVVTEQKFDRHPTELAALVGKRLARVSEIPVAKAWAEATLKQITGGDPLTARHMRQDPFVFTPQCTLIIDANNAPHVRGIDEAFRRRIQIIPFDVTISPNRVDPDLPAKLRREAPMILAWIVEGAAKWCSSGLRIPKCVTNTTSSYLDQQDEFRQFLDERFDLDPKEWVDNATLREQHTYFMDERGGHSWKQHHISEEMRKRGFVSCKSGSKRGWRGLKPKITPQVAMMPGLSP